MDNKRYFYECALCGGKEFEARRTTIETVSLNENMEFVRVIDADTKGRHDTRCAECGSRFIRTMIGRSMQDE